MLHYCEKLIIPGFKTGREPFASLLDWGQRQATTKGHLIVCIIHHSLHYYLYGDTVLCH